MALFSKKSSTKEASTKKGTVKAEAAAAKSPVDAGEAKTQIISRAKRSVLKGPRITEKAVSRNENGVYVFNVDVRSTKPEIRQAVKQIYGVEPVAIRVVNHPGKVKRRGAKVGRTAKSRKAYVTLPAGKSIDLV